MNIEKCQLLLVPLLVLYFVTAYKQRDKQELGDRLSFIKLKKGGEQLESLPHTTHCKEIARERGLWFIFLVLRFCIKIFQIILGAILGKRGGQNFSFSFLGVFHVICKYFGGG